MSDIADEEQRMGARIARQEAAIAFGRVQKPYITACKVVMAICMLSVVAVLTAALNGFMPGKPAVITLLVLAVVALWACRTMRRMNDAYWDMVQATMASESLYEQ